MAEDISSHEELHALQREDLSAIGRLLLVLGCSPAAPGLDALAASYSQGFCRATSALLASAQGASFSSWQQVRSAPSALRFGLLLLWHMYAFARHLGPMQSIGAASEHDAAKG